MDRETSAVAFDLDHGCYKLVTPAAAGHVDGYVRRRCEGVLPPRH